MRAGAPGADAEAGSLRRLLRSRPVPRRAPDDSFPRDLSRPVFAALAVGLPLALWLVHRGRGHEGDLAMFHGWYLAFRESAAFYRHRPGVNYSLLGALLV